MFSVVFFLSLQVLEVMIAVGVLGGRMTAQYGARVLQTAMQVAAFGGAALAGLALDRGGMTVVLWINAATMAVGLIGIALLSRGGDQKAATAAAEAEAGAGGSPACPDADSAAAASAEAGAAAAQVGYVVRWTSAAVLLLIMLQLSSFNFLFPIIANRFHGWTATEFGLLDAVAGAAAFAAVLAGGRIAVGAALSYLACAMILVFNLALALIADPLAVMPGVIAGAFIVTLLRIRQHARLYEAYDDPAQATRWSAHLVLGLTLSRGLAPLALGSAADVVAATTLLIAIGAAITAGMALLLAVQSGSAPLGRPVRPAAGAGVEG